MRVSDLIITWAFAAAGVVVALRTTTSTAGVESLVRRRLPRHAESFRFKIVGAFDDDDDDHDGGAGNQTETESERVNDSYAVSSTRDGKILVQGNTVGALLAG